MTWQILTAISVLALSVSVLLQRILLHKDKIDPVAYAVVFQGLVGIVLLFPAVMVGFSLPGIGELIIPAIISIVAFGIGHIVYARTLQRIEASAFSVLFATQAVWIMLAGILFFDESLTAIQIVGVAVIAVSILLLVQLKQLLKKDKGIVLGLLTGLLFGIAITCWSYVGRHTDGLSWAAISFIGTAAVTMVAWPRSLRRMAPLFNAKLVVKLLLLAVVYGAGSLAMLYAYRDGTLSEVTPLRQTSIIVTVVLALLFIRQERHGIARKITAATVCFVGVLLIVI